MESGRKEEATELMHSQVRAWNHTLSFITSLSLKCAVELGIPSAIHRHGRPMSLPDLAATLSVQPSRAPCVGRLMRLLEHSGFFATQKDEEGQEGYVLTPFSEHLRLHASPFPRAILNPVMIAPWLHLSSWLRDGEAPTPFHAVHGVSLWEYTAQHPEFSRALDDAMAQDSKIVTLWIIENCRTVFEGVRSMIDVGGGNGAVAGAIAQAFPGVTCTVLDLPRVIVTQKPSERVRFVEGNMFDWIPQADVIFLKYILHDHDDEDCVKILRRCKEAISANEGKGKVIVVDIVLNNIEDDLSKSIETQLFYDMEMMVIVGGKERDEQEWQKIFNEVGFTNYKITPIVAFLCLIEIYP